MCFYTYDKYARCGHCEICLVEFCDDAVPITVDDRAEEQKERTTKAKIPSLDGQSETLRRGSQVSHVAQPRPSFDQDTTKSSSSASANTADHITALIPQHPYKQDSAEMDAVLQWMTSETTTTNTTARGPRDYTKSNIRDPPQIASASPALPKSDHVRDEGNDKNHHLSEGNHIPQPATWNSPLNPQDIGGNNHSHSEGSMDISNLDGNFDRAMDSGDTDAMIAMINKMKVDNARLQAQANLGKTKPETERESKMDQYLNTPLSIMSDLSKMSGRNAQATLQQQQSLFEEATSQAPKKKKNKSSKKKKANRPVDDRRDSIASGISGDETGRSFSAAASDGLVVTSNDASHPSPVRRTTYAGHGTDSSPPLQTPQPEHSEERETTFTQSTFKGKGKARAMFDEPHSKPDTAAPRPQPSFAQPTQAYSIRAGETVRQEPTSTPVSPRKTLRGSPATIETEKRIQHHQKRKSIPGNWLHAPNVQQEKLGLMKTSPEQAQKPSVVTSGSPTDESPKSHGKTGGSGGPQAHLVADSIQAQMEAEEASKAGRLRKKPSGYMSPTAAATQRTIATLGQESVKHASPRVKKDGLNVKISFPSQQATSSSLSANSSVFPNYTEPKAPSSTSPHKRQMHGSDMHMSAPSSPTKIPRPANREGGRLKSHSTATTSHKRNTSTLGQLPEIANTTPKRRTSQSHLLTPIMKKLNSLSLLVGKQGQKKNFEDTAPSGSVNQPDQEHTTPAPPSDSTNASSSVHSRSSGKQSAKSAETPLQERTSTPPGMRKYVKDTLTDDPTPTGDRYYKGKSKSKGKGKDRCGDRRDSGASTIMDRKENLAPSSSQGSRHSSAVAIPYSLQGRSVSVNDATRSRAPSGVATPSGEPNRARRPSAVSQDPAIITAGPVVKTKSESSLRYTGFEFFEPTGTSDRETLASPKLSGMWDKEELAAKIEELHNEGSSIHRAVTTEKWSMRFSTDLRAATRTVSTHRSQHVANPHEVGIMGSVRSMVQGTLTDKLLELKRQVDKTNESKNQSSQYGGYYQNAPQSATQALAQAVGYSSSAGDYVSDEQGADSSNTFADEQQYAAGIGAPYTGYEATDEYSPLPTDDFMTRYNKIRARPIPVEYSAQDPIAPTYASSTPFSDNGNHYANTWRTSPGNSSDSDTGSSTPTNFQNAAQAPPPCPKSWTVGSTHPTRHYNWTGGDGREISFSGYGPLAESNPNSPINFVTAAGVHIYSDGQPSPILSAPTTAPTAPKKMTEEARAREFKRMRDSAIRQGYPMVPCGNVAFVRAQEHVSYGTRPGLAHCNDCTTKRPELLDLVDYSGRLPPLVTVGHYL